MRGGEGRREGRGEGRGGEGGGREGGRGEGRGGRGKRYIRYMYSTCNMVILFQFENLCCNWLY